jgi:hypothetical protein
MSIRIDLTGQRFGKLIVLYYSRTQKPRGEAYWQCLCDCGNEIPVTGGHLKTGHTRSCGCLQREKTGNMSRGNVWGRKYEDPRELSAKTVWAVSYADGCSLEKFLELSQLPCFYCGIRNSNSFNKYITKDGYSTNIAVTTEWAEKATFTYNGLDRVDPERDHSEDNVVPCCFPCNRSKDDQTLEEFETRIVRMYECLMARR